MKRSPQLLTAVLAGLCLTAVAQVDPKTSEPKVAVESAASSDNQISWKTFEEVRANYNAPETAYSRLIFFRPAQSGSLPANVHINGRFHSAVLPGAYAEAVVCAGTQTIELLGQGTTGVEPAKAPRLQVQTRGQQTVYVRLGSPLEPQAISPLKPGERPAELDSMPRQAHAVSRLLVPANCNARETRYSLSAELLFHFGKSDSKDLLSTGELEIVRLARKIREEHQNIESVLVNGHTDPMGSRELNQRLSQERAETVRTILVSAGLPADKVVAKGLADTQLVVPDCGSKQLNRTQLLSCNQPNRRVELLVRGFQN